MKTMSPRWPAPRRRHFSRPAPPLVTQARFYIISYGTKPDHSGSFTTSRKNRSLSSTSKGNHVHAYRMSLDGSNMNSSLHTIRDMSRLFDIRDVLHLNGHKKQIVCPLPQHVHHNRTPSFSIFTTPSGKQRFKCHGNCRCEGDVIDLA